MNIYNQNVAFNYRGILNLDATTINTPLDATLRAVTDGAGTSSLLNLSTEQVGVLRTVNLSAGATTPRLFNVAYTINNSGAQTGTLTGIFLNATETALNGMTHNLMDLQKGSVSQFLVNNIGGLSLGSGSTNTQLVINSTGSLAGIYSPAYSPNSTELLTMRNFATGALQIQFNFTSSTNPIIKLGGTTNLFPAIKRNGAAIDFRLADDSAPCDINASKGFFTTTIGEPAIRGQNTGNTGTDSVMRLTNTVTNSVLHFGAAGLLLGGTNPNLKVGNTGANVPSAIVEIISTTQGFLPPRMTTTQINAIATPAEGLVVYNTTISHLCIYQGGVWTKVNHSPM